MHAPRLETRDGDTNFWISKLSKVYSEILVLSVNIK